MERSAEALKPLQGIYVMINRNTGNDGIILSLFKLVFSIICLAIPVLILLGFLPFGV